MHVIFCFIHAGHSFRAFYRGGQVVWGICICIDSILCAQTIDLLPHPKSPPSSEKSRVLQGLVWTQLFAHLLPLSLSPYLSRQRRREGTGKEEKGMGFRNVSGLPPGLLQRGQVYDTTLYRGRHLRILRNRRARISYFATFFCRPGTYSTLLTPGISFVFVSTTSAPCWTFVSIERIYPLLKSRLVLQCGFPLPMYVPTAASCCGCRHGLPQAVHSSHTAAFGSVPTLKY